MAFWTKWFGRRPPENANEYSPPGAPTEGPPSDAVATIVHGPDGSSGFFERAYDADSATVELRYAYREDLPGWIMSPVPLVPGKGVPIVTYATLRAMKQLGIQPGKARAFVLRCVHEVESIAHLDWLIRKYPDAPIGELARRTHSYLYAETAVVQSGHKVVRVTVDTEKAVRKPIGDLTTHYERMSKDPTASAKLYDTILSKYEIARGHEVLIGYDLRIEVAPWT